MASSDALPIPRKNVAYRVIFPIFNSSGVLVSGAAGLDSEVSKDQGSPTDCTNEATEIGSSGMYYLDLTSTEMNADCVMVIVKTTTVDARTTPLVLYPEETGDIRVSVTAWIGTALTEGAVGRAAAALINFFNVTSPTGTVNSLPAAAAGANGGLPTGDASGRVTVGTLASGVITTTSIADGAFTAAKFASDVFQTIWDKATSALTTSGSIGKLLVDNINATISSRSTYAGGDTSGTSTLLSRISAAITITGGKVDVNDKTGFSLSSGGVQAIWDFATSSIVAVGSIGKLLKDNIDTVLSTIYSRIGAPAGASVSADILAIKTDTGNLVTRLTSARAGYLDNLNVGGVVASQADINALNQSASRRVILTSVEQYERPESGSSSYVIEARTYDGDGAAVDADSTPTLTATGIVTGSLAANLSAASHPATGVYRWTYTVVNNATTEQVRFDVSATLSSSTFTLSLYSQVVDLVSATWTTTDQTHLTAIYNKLPSKSNLTGTNNADGDVQLDEMTGGLPTQAKADVNAEADTALADYDAPTNAEMVARTLAAASYATATNLSTVDTKVTAIKAQTDLLTFNGTDLIVTLNGESVVISDIDTTTANKLADIIARRHLSDIEASANGDTLDYQSLYGASARLVNKTERDVDADTVTLYKSDGTTPLIVFDVVTDPDAEPVIEIAG